MSGLVDQIKNIFQFDEEEDMYTDFPEEDTLDTEEEVVRPTRTKGLAPVRPINSRNYEVMVVSPKTFDESLEIAKNLIDRKTVVLNLELLGHEDSQRIVDFLAGSTYALNGHQQKIGEGVFIFTPNNVNISAEAEKKAAASITDAIWSGIQVK
ncbi:MAG: cell division protein SepF [Candidatus Gastranaerophilales bacterium]|nr:cell division protein SepF [Candidatus Gastranaerophilales bacterium]